jgi:Mn-dependent DtxR family transcriptional regulator
MKRERNLTMRQVQTVATIRNYIHCHGHAPTLRELAALLDRSRGTVMQRIRSLDRKGVIRHCKRAHRTLEILPPKPRRNDMPEPDAIDTVDMP